MRKRLFDPAGELFVPRCIRCYMFKRHKAADYITVVYTHANEFMGPLYKGRYIYRGYSDASTWCWGEALIGCFAAGSRVRFEDLPLYVQGEVIRSYADYWGVDCSIRASLDGYRVVSWKRRVKEE